MRCCCSLQCESSERTRMEFGRFIRGEFCDYDGFSDRHAACCSWRCTQNFQNEVVQFSCVLFIRMSSFLIGHFLFQWWRFFLCDENDSMWFYNRWLRLQFFSLLSKHEDRFEHQRLSYFSQQLCRISSRSVNLILYVRSERWVLGSLFVAWVLMPHQL